MHALHADAAWDGSAGGYRLCHIRYDMIAAQLPIILDRPFRQVDLEVFCFVFGVLHAMPNDALH